MFVTNCFISEIAKHKYLRSDVKYQRTIASQAHADFALVKDLFYIINGSVQTKYYSEEETGVSYVRVGDISYKYGISNEKMMYLNDDCCIAEDKQLRKNDLVLATIGTVGKIGLVEEFSGGTFSNNTVCLRPKSVELNSYFYEKLLQSDYYIGYIFGVVSQKAQPNLQQYDLENIRIPIIDKDNIENCVADCKRIDKKIMELKEQARPIQALIDSVFSREFGFDYTKLEELKASKRFIVKLSDFSNNPDLRFSTKFHRSAGAFVMEQLQGITNKKIKHYLAEPIVLGESVSPNDYFDDGEYFYISMATIKNWRFESEDAKRVSKAYSDIKQAKTIRRNDILLARSGEGTIGKVALIDNEDVRGVFADFTMRIRLTNYNGLFAYYYFRTAFFQYLIEVYKKGLGNNTNIFPSVVREFPLPDISLSEQQRIVNEIKAEIEKQDLIKAKIAELRGQIDAIIENALRNPL
ncbi:MAG: restriction endonuclease subunit S [Defluviitaleaceae bacterium]|nr:restriction endonuclease subunit S [Defluviitaleaceae bacterium]